ncbi:Uncharacterized protein BM_BM4373 [Brugia malayi]|uniref:Bm4373, isoform c n=1 Tax=Brugia malayi TaxID=6279 RepID=A0A1U7F279_BRUMA|nr:Uncharacterized protein BM_BM4373 [Brugia malayi]CDQ00704.1 Bm4373, isoform c [Brugia malayi]VIO86460.1 Uncharacterized protein BM_BM4373 [Brugia malayi]
MKFEFAVLLLLNSITGTLQLCDYITLVKCFISILDEWAWTLYELKDNVVTINENQCEHLRQLDLCIKDAGPVKHECEHSEILAASNTEGQEILREHRECLMEERIGEMTLSAGTYLSERFLEHPDDQVCQEVNNKLHEYISAMKGICHSESAQVIMCKSLRNMFKGLHADKLHSCDFDCNIPQLDEIAEPGLATVVHHEGSLSGTTGEDNLIPEAVNEHAATATDGGAPESHSLNSSSSPSTCLIHSISLLLTSIVFS